MAGHIAFPATQEDLRVDISAGIQASLAGRYASALFDLASENGTVTVVESDLDALGQALAEVPEFAALITNPRVSRNDAKTTLAALSRTMQLSPLTANFLGVVAQNRRLAQLPAIIRAFRAIAAAQRGEVTAEVTSAHPLTDSQIETLRTKLTAREGRTVKLVTRTDPDLLGGLVVTLGSKRIDASIRTRLNTLAQAMKA
jgi:F-type H+-transporting ATPase subunit delta